MDEWRDEFNYSKGPTECRISSHWEGICLRGGAEQRNLKLSQFQRCEDSYVYHENTSKNRNWSIKQLHIRKKVVPIYSCPQAGDQCPVSLLDKYISRLPEEAKEKDIFYVRPLESAAESPETRDIWYYNTAIPIGKHTLQQKFSRMCQAAGIVGRKTNHSLRATAASEMFARQVPEKLIQERTGHHSLEALRTYERSNEEQHKAVSSVLCDSKPSTYSQQIIQSTKSCTLSIHGASTGAPAQSSSLTMPGGNVTFNNLHGCTINVTQAPPPTQLPLMPNIELTKKELDELFSHISA
jgi:hypothetical protein